jgi:hypothetical protein
VFGCEGVNAPRVLVNQPCPYYPGRRPKGDAVDPLDAPQAARPPRARSQSDATPSTVSRDEQILAVAALARRESSNLPMAAFLREFPRAGESRASLYGQADATNAA